MGREVSSLLGSCADAGARPAGRCAAACILPILSLGTDANAEVRAAGWTDASAPRGSEQSEGGGERAAPGGRRRQREEQCE